MEIVSEKTYLPKQAIDPEQFAGLGGFLLLARIGLSTVCQSLQLNPHGNSDIHG